MLDFTSSCSKEAVSNFFVKLLVTTRKRREPSSSKSLLIALSLEGIKFIRARHVSITRLDVQNDCFGLAGGS